MDDLKHSRLFIYTFIVMNSIIKKKVSLLKEVHQRKTVYVRNYFHLETQISSLLTALFEAFALYSAVSRTQLRR